MRNTDKHPAVVFFKFLYQHCDGGFIDLRQISEASHVIQNFIPVSEINSIPSILGTHKDRNCYFGVATRRDGDGSKDGILEIPAPWVDLDIYKLSDDQKKESRQRYKNFPLKATFIIDSGGGRYLFWILKESASREDIPKIENLLKRLAFYFHGDPAATDASRILRIPGSINHKYLHLPQVKLIESYPERQYNIEDFDSILPQIEGAINGEEKPRLPEGWERDVLSGKKEGERNSALAQLAGRYFGKGLSRDETLLLCRGANSQYLPPLSDSEVITIVNSIWKTDQKNHPDASNLSAKSFFLPTFSDIYDLDIKVEWVVEKLIPKQAVTVLHGKGGIGKTWLMLQTGSCVAEGISFCGLSTQKMPCHYIDFENSLATLHDRAIVLGKSGLQVWHISNPIPPPRLDSNEWVRYKELSSGFLIFDTLRASQLLDENSSKDMATIMMRLKELRDMGFTIVLIHHTPKSDERTYKGSTAIQDQCDHVLSLDRVKNVGSEQEVEGDEDDLDHPLRLGVRGKTRYEPFSLYLQFDPGKGFEVAPDPDDELLKNIHSLLAGFREKEGISPNQTRIITLAKDQGINRKKLLRLLRKGEGRLWNSVLQPKTRAILYDPNTIIPLSPYI
jgi:archaellum biogenesis ATPase FlaH